jgi:ABC transporter substrate binding protein
MCGRARLSSDVSEIELVFSIPPRRPTPNNTPSWKVVPTDPLLVGWVSRIKPDERATIIGRRPSQRMRRRELMLLLTGAMTAARALRAQQKGMPVVGYLNSFSSPQNLDDLSRGPIHQGLSETGYVEGQNMASEYRWAEGHYNRLPELAADLVSRKVDLIVTIGGTPPALAAKNATSTIPIVFAGVGDPVGAGLVASLARPGGNLTGFSNITIELTAKRLELLSELVPQAGVIALLVNPNNPTTRAADPRHAGSGSRERGAACCPQGRERERDRRRLRLPRPTACRRSRRRSRRVLQRAAGAACGAGIAPCPSGDL